MENIDLIAAKEKNILCVNSPEGNRDAVAEHAIGMLLMLFNKLKRADNEVRVGKWLREENRGLELGGKTIGIIGYGNTGSSLAKKLQGFGMNILVYDKYKKDFGNEFVKESTLEEIFVKADILSLHVPLTAETNYLVNDAFIEHFENNIYVVNTARGKCLNTADLVKNMKTGKVLGACLDVLEYEAVSFESVVPIAIGIANLPEPLQYLVKSDKVILTPHIAGWTQESNVKIAEFLAGKIINAFK